MQAARGRGAAAVAAAVRGALRASTPTRTTRLFPPAASPGPPGFLYLDFFPPFSSREDAAVITKVRGARGGSPPLGLLGPPLQVVGAHLKLAGPGGQTTRSTSLFLVGPGTRIFLGFTVEISARDECRGEGME